MKKKSILILFFLFSLVISGSAKANYWLIIGTYRQGPGRRPEVSGITSPSLHSIPMKDLDTFKKQIKITNSNKILFNNLISDGPVYLVVINNKVTF